MNDYDRSQLHFIMNLDDYEFDKWASNISAADLTYALELIKQARVEAHEAEHDCIEYELAESNLAEANAVLKKFML